MFCFIMSKRKFGTLVKCRSYSYFLFSFYVLELLAQPWRERQGSMCWQLLNIYYQTDLVILFAVSVLFKKQADTKVYSSNTD